MLLAQVSHGRPNAFPCHIGTCYFDRHKRIILDFDPDPKAFPLDHYVGDPLTVYVGKDEHEGILTYQDDIFKLVIDVPKPVVPATQPLLRHQNVA